MLYVILYTHDIFILSIYSSLYNPPCYSVYTRYCAISLLSIYNPLYRSIYIVFDIIMFSSSRSKPSVYFCNKPRRNIFLAASLYGTKMDGAKQRTVPPSAMQGKYIHRQKEGGEESCCEGTGEDAEIWEGMKVGMAGWLFTADPKITALGTLRGVGGEQTSA